MIPIELLIYLSTILSLFHLLNALTCRRKRGGINGGLQRPMSILIPCYNEEDAVALSLQGIIQIDYRKYEVIYINDGSCDDTMQTLRTLLELEDEPQMMLGSAAVYQSCKYPNIRVADKPNGGKSDALNLGIRLAREGLVVTLDADSVLAKDALKVMSKAFSDENVVAAGGAIHIMQGYETAFNSTRYRKSKSILVSLQMLEYLKGFYVYKYSLARQNATAIISGAFGVFRKQILKDVGGFRKTLGEDIDMTLRIQKMIHKTRKKIIYLPEALCYTQCPENWNDLKKQRLRWQKGFIDCVVVHWRFLLRTFLTKSLSFHFLVEALVVGVCACMFTLVTFFAVPVLTFVDQNLMMTFLFYQAVAIVLGTLYSFGAFLVSAKFHRYPKGAWRKVLTVLLCDLVFYRWVTMFFYLFGTLIYFANRQSRESWNKVKRRKELSLNHGV